MSRKVKFEKAELVKLDIDLSYDRIKAAIAADKSKEKIMAIYGTTSDSECKQLVMNDILLLESRELGITPFKNYGAKTNAVNKLLEVYPCCQKTAYLIYDDAMKRVLSLINVSKIIKKSFDVSADIIQRIYQDLGYIDDMIQEEKSAEEPNSNKILRLIGNKQRYYDQLLVYVKICGVDLYSKTSSNYIEKEKVEVMKEKVLADSKYQQADIAIRAENLVDTVNDLAQAIMSDRTMLNALEAHYTVLEGNDGQRDVSSDT